METSGIPRLYRVSEAAEMLRVSPRQMLRYLDAGEMPFVHLHKRNRAGLRLIPEDALMAFLNRHGKSGFRLMAATDGRRHRHEHGNGERGRGAVAGAGTGDD